MTPNIHKLYSSNMSENANDKFQLRDVEPATRVTDPQKAEYMAYATKPIEEEVVEHKRVAKIHMSTPDSNDSRDYYKDAAKSRIEFAREARQRANDEAEKVSQLYDELNQIT